MVDLTQSQKVIGAWSMSTFGATPADFHAARMTREMADVLDCIAKGDMATLGRALAGVFVVGLALAESQEIDLAAAILAEHTENISSHWVRSSWGQWDRAGDGSVPDTLPVQIITDAAAEGVITPAQAARALTTLGAKFEEACAYLCTRVGLRPSDFEAPSPINPDESDGAAMMRMETEQAAAVIARRERRSFKLFDVPSVIEAAAPPLPQPLIIGRGCGED